MGLEISIQKYIQTTTLEGSILSKARGQSLLQHELYEYLLARVELRSHQMIDMFFGKLNVGAIPDFAEYCCRTVRSAGELLHARTGATFLAKAIYASVCFNCIENCVVTIWK